MNNQTILVNSEQQCFEMFSEPLHFPLVIGNETLIVTMQDQRNVIDRRNWYLSHPPNATSAAAALPPGMEKELIHLYPLIAQILHNINEKSAPSMQMPATTYRPPIHVVGQEKPFCFHYEKQTDTEDLPYFQNYDRLRHGEKVIKHVHYYVESAVKSKASNTNSDTANIRRIEAEEITDIEDIIEHSISME